MVHFAMAVACALIAEGVETEAEATMPRELGVSHAQGYLFGRPARFRGGGRAGPGRRDSVLDGPGAAARAHARSPGRQDPTHPESTRPNSR
ncbi:MAG: hypothetical protein ACYDCI_08390 [Candidatus Limnocylindrales bacterium]